MELRRVVYGCTVLALLAGPALADDKKKAAKAPADPQAEMAKYEEAAAPAEQHRQLQKMVGKWNLSFKSWMAPDQPPMESTGTAEAKSLMGDRYVQTTINSTNPMMPGKPFSGQGTTGYDKTKKKFVGTWIDSMSTGIMRSEGTSDPSGKVMTSQITGTDPVTGKENKMKIVGKWESDDKLVEEFFEKRGGKETKTMEITYSRAK
jgi:hypothetical protein